jgi:hypothetical protein
MQGPLDKIAADPTQKEEKKDMPQGDMPEIKGAKPNFMLNLNP